MKYQISQIAEILQLPRVANEAMVIDTLLTDSRSLTYPETTLFFAMRSRRNDGHRYLQSLYDRGVRNFVVEYIPQSMQSLTDVNFLTVSNVTAALQSIASFHRNSFAIPVVGITGSRGKTTVKEWLYNLLQEDYNIVRSPRSYNSQIGVPMSIWEMTGESQLAIFEAGVSQNGEMKSLQKMIRPNVGIITNVGDEHNDGFESLRHKCEEKVQLFDSCDCIIYNGDDELIADVVAQKCGNVDKFAWSRNNREARLYVPSVEASLGGSSIAYVYGGVSGEVKIPFTSQYDIENAIHCLAMMLYLQLKPDVIAERMSRLVQVGTRLNVIEGVNNCSLIYDNYTADLHSLLPAIEFMERRATSAQSLTVILSDVYHEAMTPDEVYGTMAQLMARKNVHRVIGIGEEIARYSTLFGNSASFYCSTNEFLSAMSPNDFESELILVKGASHFGFGRIVDVLEARQHETVLEVNLDAVVHNYNIYRSLVKPETGVVCMVKASGYGAGSYELAKTLQSQGASYLAVAAYDEGVDLRKAGITMPIMVLNPRVVNYQMLFDYNLEPEIYSFDILREIINEAQRYGTHNYPVHIKLDTGMHRLGFLEQDIPQIVELLRNQDAIAPRSVFSHLAAADCPDMDDYTRQQFDYFDRCCEQLQQGFDHHILRHVLNSTGITRFPEHQCDMVRLGICLYGIPTMTDGSQSNLRPVSSLHSVILSIKEWPEGTTVGYSRRGMLHRDSRIATIPIGYADGIDRHLGNGNACVFINGHRCPTIGNICMDVCMIDVTDVACQPGDQVEIFGDNIPVVELAEKLDTIPYEILTSISSRVKRVYYRE